MKPHYIVFAAVAACSLYAIAAPPSPLPAPWFLTGESPKMYEAGIDQSATGDTNGAKFLRQVRGSENDWASLMQQISAEDYRGKRIRFQARIKTQDVSGWAGLWMRVDTPTLQAAAFYNNQDKPIKGSTVWQVRDVVLNVPENASAISFGVIDNGKGQVWIDTLKFDVVGNNVPVSGASALPHTPSL